jgi:hypothetical protein
MKLHIYYHFKLTLLSYVTIIMTCLESDEVHDGVSISFMDHVSISSMDSLVIRPSRVKVETPIHDSIRELVTWECKEHGVKS